MSKRNCNCVGNIKYTKKVLRQPWNALTLQLSLSVRDKQEICLLCMFISPEATVVNLFAILRLFVGLAS